MNLKRRIANSGGCLSMFSLAVWICIWFTNLSKFHLRSREGNRCWDSLIWVIHSTPVESMDTILIMGSCVPLERLLLKTKTKNKTKQKKNEKENEKWEEEWTQTERRLDQTWLILRTWSVGFPLKSVTASKK